MAQHNFTLNNILHRKELIFFSAVITIQYYTLKLNRLNEKPENEFFIRKQILKKCSVFTFFFIFDYFNKETKHEGWVILKCFKNLQHNIYKYSFNY